MILLNMAKKSDANLAPRIVNRKATHDYAISERLEVGIVLRGSEVKSIRQGQVSLAEGFARVEPSDMGLYLHDVEISPYANASGPNGHVPKTVRKLLAHRRQIQKLHDLTSTKGTTLIPLAMYFVRGMVKLEIGVGTGKRTHDKREDIKARESDREIRRAMSKKLH
jgi:SsrA-binding protein